MNEQRGYTLAQMRIFLEVARTESLTVAAQRLHLTQSALSASIRKLEASIGEPLFVRAGRGIRLCKAGNDLLPSAQVLIERADRAERALDVLAGAGTAEITLSFSPALVGALFYGRVSAFMASNPAVRLNLRAFAGERSIQALRAGRVDLVYGPAIESAGVVQEIVGSTRLVAVFRQGHPAVARPTVGWSMLAGESLIVLSDGKDLLRRVGAELGSEITRLSMGPSPVRLESLVSLVRCGLGVGLVSAIVGELLDREGLCVRPLSEPAVVLSLALSRVASADAVPAVDRLAACLAGNHGETGIGASSD